MSNPDVNGVTPEQQALYHSKKIKKLIQHELFAFLGFGLMWGFFAGFPMFINKSFYFYSEHWWQNFIFLIGPYTIYLICNGISRLIHLLEYASNVSKDPNASLKARLLSTEITFFSVFFISWTVFITVPMWLMTKVFQENHLFFNIFLIFSPALIYLTGRILMILFAWWKISSE